MSELKLAARQYAELKRKEDVAEAEYQRRKAYLEQARENYVSASQKLDEAEKKLAAAAANYESGKKT